LIRDVIIVEHGRYPTPVSDLLESAGFTVFRLDRSFFGPRLRPADDPSPVVGDPSFFASLNATRARSLLSPVGWRALGTPMLRRTGAAWNINPRYDFRGTSRSPVRRGTTAYRAIPDVV